jgi:hypothetical protein
MYLSHTIYCIGIITSIPGHKIKGRVNGTVAAWPPLAIQNQHMQLSSTTYHHDNTEKLKLCNFFAAYWNDHIRKSDDDRKLLHSYWKVEKL